MSNKYSTLQPIMISVLLVDDEPVLLDIGRMFLEKSGGFEISEVSSGKEALQCLRQEHYDAIVADYEMPEMDGLALLREVRTYWPDIPYILFTGRGREEVVIEALNSGADFYLQKGGDPKSQFTELAHKIKQAVIARKVSSDLRESEETFRQFFEAAGEAIFILDGDLIVDSNYQGLILLGREREEILNKNLVNFSTPIQPDGGYAESEILEKITLSLTGVPQVFEWQILKSDDSLEDTEVSMSCVTIHGRRLVHAIIRDISARKREEEERVINEIRLKAILDLYAMHDNNLKELTDFAIASAVRITRSSHAYLTFVSEDESILTMYSWSDMAMNESRIPNKPSTYEVKNSGLLGEAVRLRRPVISNNIEEASIGKKELPDGHIRILRYLNIPIFDRNHIVLLAGVANKQDLYNDEDVHQLTLLMTSMWGIIRRKKTEEILEKKNSDLMVAFKQLKTIERDLIRSNQRLMLQSDLTRHDILNNLTPLTEFLNLLGEEGCLSPDVSITVKQAQDAVEKIQFLLTFFDDNHNRSIQETECLSAEDALKTAISQLNQQDVIIKNRLNGIFIKSNPLFSRALYIILENSIRHGLKVTTIDVYAEANTNYLKIIIEDDGVGVTSSMKELIFSQDFGNNTGMGLFLVRKIFHITGIEIHETGNPGFGARFEISIPIGQYKNII
ncbi:MAG: response regulator [Methanobacteriota archaeon]